MPPHPPNFYKKDTSLLSLLLRHIITRSFVCKWRNLAKIAVEILKRKKVRLPSSKTCQQLTWPCNSLPHLHTSLGFHPFVPRFSPELPVRDLSKFYPTPSLTPSNLCTIRIICCINSLDVIANHIP